MKHSEIVILAVKPPLIQTVLHDIKDYVTPNHLMISIAAGITLNSVENVLMSLIVYCFSMITQTVCVFDPLKQSLPNKTKVVRVMSNTPVLVRQGATVFALGQHASKEDGELVKKLFESVGVCGQVDESLIDAVTALSGAGPAYVSHLNQSILKLNHKMRNDLINRCYLWI